MSPTFGRLGATASVLLVLAAACTAPGGGTTTTTTTTVAGPPVVAAFTASPANSTAPALVALGWSVSDPEGDPLTCQLDVDGDGSDDMTFTDCAGTASRNISIPAPGVFIPRLTVTDGTDTVIRTTGYTVGAGVSETYDIVLRPQSSLTTEQTTAFTDAEARWESVVVRGVPSATVNLAAGACNGANGAINATVDDLVIDVEIVPIDGSGSILGQAGPCIIGIDERARFGIMQFDSADVGDLSESELREVILHEMGHVLGYGTLWSYWSGLTGAGTSDPRFVGTRAVAEWSTLGRTGNVPVEGSGGPGTADAHWRESTFDRELMTGYLDSSPNPLSALTIASLADIGLQVDISQADAYSLPPGALRRAESSAAPVGRIVLVTPVGVAPVP